MTALSLLVKSVLELPSSGDVIPTTLTPDEDCSRLCDECVGTEEAETLKLPTLSRAVWLTAATAVLNPSRNAWVFAWSYPPNLSDARTAVGAAVGRAVGIAVGLKKGEA